MEKRCDDDLAEVVESTRECCCLSNPEHGAVVLYLKECPAGITDRAALRSAAPHLALGPVSPDAGSESGIYCRHTLPAHIGVIIAVND